ncbi:apolipoprotein C-I isoform X2 [Suricata suricatta]|uniref:apolipoprotein C-I isoform X2 n=1 Tax=Suricata suricatta TaxID=37032 RepID=UPI001155E7EA|nr:apolipoprotein C-I isoform X2 [Suricata suricatta]
MGEESSPIKAWAGPGPPTPRRCRWTDPECPFGPAMRLILWLPVLVVVLLLVLEGPAPAQGAPDIASTFKNIPDSLKEFGNTLKDAFKSIPEATGKFMSSIVGKLGEGLKSLRNLQS